jgi:hypothetical protein
MRVPFYLRCISDWIIDEEEKVLEDRTISEGMYGFEMSKMWIPKGKVH